ncbi:MAG: hypothetical protein V3T16_00105 [Gemmatimonadales bacterium]
MGVSTRSWALGLSLGVFSVPAAAQEPLQAAGTVLRVVPGDSVPQPGVRVVLHRVGRDAQGPLDSTLTGPGGQFTFTFVSDTTAVYILSARHYGIEYFSSPIHTNPELPDTAIVLVVSDTSSQARIEVASRQIVIGNARSDGAWDIVDLINLENRTTETRVPGVSQRPTWVTPIDRDIVGFDVGASDFSPEAVFHRDGTVEVFGPIPPGSKDLLLRYLIPAGKVRWPIAVGDTVRDLSILIEDETVRVLGPVFEAPQPQVVAGRSFTAWRARLTAADTITVVFPAGPPAGGTVALVVLVGVMVLALGTAGLAWYRRAPTQAVVAPEEPIEVLVRRLAMLDARYQGREAEVASDEWSEYQVRRSTLKRQLELALARTRPTS